MDQTTFRMMSAYKATASGPWIIIASGSTPFITAYSWNGTFGARVANPTTLPPAAAYGVAFTPAGDYIAVAHNTTPFVSVYPWTGTFGTKVADPSTAIPSTGYDVTFSLT